MQLGAVRIESFMLGTGERLAVFVVLAVALAIVGVRIASFVTQTTIDDDVEEDADADELEAGS